MNICSGENEIINIEKITSQKYLCEKYNPQNKKIISNEKIIISESDLDQLKRILR